MIRKILIMSLIMLIVNCQPENEEIENVLVDFSINIQLPFYNSLSIVGNSIQINASENLGISGYCCGVKGIIIYHHPSGEYMAYERNCTFQPNNSCSQVNLLEENILLAVDSCCGSKFLLLDGSVYEGPANVPLKKYNTNFDGTYINIFN